MSDAGDLAAYREQARTWLGEHVPAGWSDGLRGAGTAERLAFQRWWLAELRTGGYAAPHWPTEFGGAGATMPEQVALHQEMARSGAPDLPMFLVSLNHTAVTLIEHGTPEQRRHLDAILDGTVWCQGFSEPDAGSDLASLSTRADRHGDVYVVNGQKVWSSFAEHAGWCILLARTDRDAPKRKGISFFLLDMTSPGIDVGPIRQINGEAEFCELFLTDVEIPAANLVGVENGGWTVAQSTLSTERGPAMVAVTEQLRTQLDGLTDLLLDTGRAGDSAAWSELGSCYAEVEIAHLLGERLIAALMDDTVGPVDASVFKVFFSELLQRVTGAGLRHEGLPGLLARPAGAGPSGVSGVWMTDHLSSWMYTIAGGTNEIQRNIIAERGFALPRDPVAS